MSLLLEKGTKPHGLSAKTMGGQTMGAQTLILGEYEISMFDFLCLAHYVITNTNLEGESDPRLQFIESMKAMEAVDGYPEIIMGETISTKRLVTNVDPIIV
jgi:hypothetical protein